MGIYFLKKLFKFWDLPDLCNLISISLDLAKNLEQYLQTSGTLEPYMDAYLFFKNFILTLGPLGPLQPFIYLSRSY